MRPWRMSRAGPNTNASHKPTTAPRAGGTGGRTSPSGLGNGPRRLQRRRRRLDLLPSRPRPQSRLPLERGRHGRVLRREADLVSRPVAVERGGRDPQGAACSASAVRRATTAKTSRSTGGTSTAPRRTPGTPGATTTRRPPYPYEDLIETNARRRKLEPEYELVDTGIFDDGRYWVVTVDYAKKGPHDLLMRVTIENAGPEAATLEVLPTLWYRNTWSWGYDDVEKPSLRFEGGRVLGSGPGGALALIGEGSRRRCSATTRPIRSGCSRRRTRPPIPRTGSGTTSSTATRPSTLSRSGRRPPSTTR